MEASTNKQRHGCVTAWLVLMIIANAFLSIVYLFFGNALSDGLGSSFPQSIMLLFAVLAIINLVFAIMLFKWKKWAFWGFVGSSLIALILNLSMGLDVGSSLTGLIGIAILYGILQIKQNGVSAWENLE